MIATEGEMMVKQCRLVGPIPRNAVKGQLVTNDQVHIGFLTCSGHGCGHWRWLEPDSEHPNWSETAPRDRRGYCGMAGEPRQ